MTDHLRDLIPDPKNARKHNPRNIGLVRDSLQEVGAARSIVIDEDNVILAGNGVVEAAAEAGIERVRVVEADGNEIIAVRRRGLTPHQKTRLGLFDNRTPELAEWETDVLAGLNDDGLLDGLFRDDELAALLAAASEPSAGLTDPDAVPEPPAEPTTKPGDLWRLGRHRLLCGDSTGGAAFADPCDLVMTSPPYWVGKDYETEHTWDEVQSFISVVAGNLARATKQTGRIVINTGTTPASSLTGQRAHIRLLVDDWQRELSHYGWLMRYVRIWAKRGGLGLIAPSMDVVDQHWEFIAVFYHPSGYQGQRRVGEPWATDGIWDMHGEMSSHGHVSAFPVEIPARNIRLYTDPGARVFDPFLGSGTTMIAAEELGRTCDGIERDPAYCDVTVRRWEQFTGQTAELVRPEAAS